MREKTIIVTGGAGFIGSWFAIKAISLGYYVIVLDKLTYCGNLANLQEIEDSPNYKFIKGDISDSDLVDNIFAQYHPSFIVNFAAESHVDNSINGPSVFVQTNIVGTFTLLESARKYWQKKGKPQNFRFVHISTDEVYGSLALSDERFVEESPYAPNSPYSASKAGSDHLVRSWFETYQMPCIITNCSNNFGPKQYPEKLIPKTIISALAGRPIEIYGKGQNIRDWIYVEDHVEGVNLALTKGIPGQKYLFGGDCEIRNIDLVLKICDIIEELTQKKCHDLITYIEDRLGHDYRYAINASKAKKEIGFLLSGTFFDNLKKTVMWYVRK